MPEERPRSLILEMIVYEQKNANRTKKPHRARRETILQDETLYTRNILFLGYKW
jgi:hypothetical protein